MTETVTAKEVGKRLTALRGTKSQEAIANAAGVSVSAISMYENGERMPRDEIKVRLAGIFGRTVQEIFFSDE